MPAHLEIIDDLRALAWINKRPSSQDERANGSFFFHAGVDDDER